MTAEPKHQSGHFSNIRRFVTFGLFGLFVSFLPFSAQGGPAFGWQFSIFNFQLSTARAATPPAIITYQGKLLNSSSQAVTTTVSMKLILYTALSGGSVVYTAGGTVGSPTAISITPTNGIFTVSIGDGTLTNTISPEIFQTNQSLYLEVQIGSDTLSPRRQITAAPYAYNSKYLDGVAATSTASSSTYIPISDSIGNFNFRHVTSTDIYVSGTSTFAASATFNGSVTVSKEVVAEAIKDAMGWVSNHATPAKLSTGFNNGGFGGGATPGNFSMTSTDFSYFDTKAVNSSSAGFMTAVFDGRYVYFASRVASNFINGFITRYDTLKPFSATSSYAFFDAGANAGSGYGLDASVFDGRYVYFLSYTGAHILKYDTQATFESPSSWLFVEIGTNATFNPYNGLRQDYYNTMLFDGKYIYFVPYLYEDYNTSDLIYYGKFLRLNTQLDITTDAAWDYYDTEALNASSIGYEAAIFDGRYAYFFSESDGFIARLDTTATFNSAGSWSFSVVRPFGSFAKGAVFDGRYIYIRSDYTKLMRYDTSSSFTATSSYGFMDITGLGSYTRFAEVPVFDGRFIYFAPTVVTSPVTPLLRFDTTGSFNATSSYSLFDKTSVTSTVNVFGSGVFDGNYIYYAPNKDYPGSNFTYRGVVFRQRAWSGGVDSTQSISKIARGSDLFLDSNSKVGLGTTAPTSLLTLYGTSSSTLGMAIGNGITTTTIDHQNGFVFASSTANPSGLFNTNIFSGNTSVSGTFRTFGGVSNMGISVSSTPTTNTIFSYYANTSVGNALVFDTNVRITSSTSALYSWRNNNQKLMSLSASGTLDVYGSISSMNATLGSPGTPGDLSERVDVRQSQFNEIMPGDVLTVDLDSPDTYKISTGNTTDPIMGVVATNPTLVLGNGKTEYTKVLTFLGRTNVKASLKNGSIHKGDPLTNATDEPGKAMRQTTPGPTIGTALEDYFEYTEQNHGQILALVRPGYWGNSSLNLSSSDAPSTVGYGVESVMEALKQIGIEIVNGVVRIKELVANSVTSLFVSTQKLCLEGVCITEPELNELLIKNGLSSTNSKTLDTALADPTLTASPASNIGTSTVTNEPENSPILGAETSTSTVP